MNGQLPAQTIDFCITDYCTLNCKSCIVGIPYVQKKHHVLPEEMDYQLQEIFKIWDTCVRLNLVGGEALLHPNIYEIVKTSLKYQNQFQSMRITTNGTIVLKDELLKLLSECGKPFDFVISNYGMLSKNLSALVKQLRSYQIPYRIDNYTGDDQYYGGWVDLGDYQRIERSGGELKETYQGCCQVKTRFLSIYHGKVLQCVRAHRLLAVEGILPGKEDYIDLYDASLPIEKKREIASHFFQNPTETCEYCLGFNDKTAKRFPAARQLEGSR